MRSLKAPIPCILMLVAMLSPHAKGAYVLTVSQSGSNVVANGSGSINTAGLSNGGTATIGAALWPSFPFGSLIEMAAGVQPVKLWLAVSGPASFGSGPQVFASSASGSTIGLIANDGLYLDPGYVSGSPLSSTATWNNTTIAGLGLTPGTYTYTWGTGPNADSFTLIIGAVPPSPTPIPSSLYLVAAGGALVAAWRIFAARAHSVA